MKRLHLLLYMALACLGLQAQDEEQGEQLLVFRNTGVVNLLYTNEVDSILTTDSTQVFYAKDTTLIVPFAELDSVAVGSRNEIEIRNDVREMTAGVDLPWIIRFDGNSIFYRLKTPDNILPKVGERLFYGLDGSDPETAVFPYGLTARATAVTTLSDEIRVDLEMLELKDIFKKFFYAGPIIQKQPASIKQRRADRENGGLDYEGKIELEIPFLPVGDIEINGKLTAKGPVVIHPFANYYSADIDLGMEVDLDLKLSAEESCEHHYESFNGHYQQIATLYKVLNVGIALGAFADLKAELFLDFGLERSWHRRMQWERRGNEQSWNFPNMEEKERDKNQAKAELVLDGSVFFGPIAGLEIATVGSFIGARAKLKVGPEIEGKINLGMLENLRDYDAEVYGQAKLDVCSKISLEGSVINRHYLAWGEIDEHKVAETNLTFGGWTWNLFPNYQQTRSVQEPQQTVTKVSVATKSDNEIAYEVESGFEIVDINDKVVDSIFVDKIKAETKEVQGMTTTFELPETYKKEELKVRPIFHYAGYTIRAQETNVMKEVNLQPITSYGTNGFATFISGATVIGTAKNETTVMNIGNYLPIPVRDTVFVKKPSIIIGGEYLTDVERNELIGSWSGEFNEEPLTLVFEDSDKGTWEGSDKKIRPFDYKLNVPQSGDLLLQFNDVEEPQILIVVSIDPTTLVLRRKKDTTQYILYKQY